MVSGAQNVMTGDQDFGTSLPVTQVEEDQLIEEKKMARYSKSAEFKRLKDYMEGRIKFFQSYLPDGRAIAGIDPDVNLSEQWRAANTIIAEFRSVLTQYDNAREVVEDSDTGRN